MVDHDARGARYLRPGRSMLHRRFPPNLPHPHPGQQLLRRQERADHLESTVAGNGIGMRQRRLLDGCDEKQMAPDHS